MKIALLKYHFFVTDIDIEGTCVPGECNKKSVESIFSVF